MLELIEYLQVSIVKRCCGPEERKMLFVREAGIEERLKGMWDALRGRARRGWLGQN